MTTICKFCKNEAQYTPLVEMEKLGVEIYFCYPCNTEYLCWKITDYGYSIYTDFKDKTYRWSTDMNNTYGDLYSIDDPGIPGVKKNEGLKMIKSFKGDLPDITPSNINEKLSVYLWFI
ncbi:hypothetical protein UFOVP1290_123 [uncultured Caudovirales phage]|uniref:Uncharacterized protein n=1 Tax=uncultured Caudovirales phage TaxID=2100421 RepID=A0A6J5RGY3_9CAUD|nr:hypothetical protein UFOVP1290_123 [uncultured Caudovirales phage]